MDPLIITHLFIYPVKSLGGIEVSSASVLPKGLAYDRRWMLIDGDNRFLTQRNLPGLALFKTALVETGQSKISVACNGDALAIPDVPCGESFTTGIWDDKVEVVEVSKAVSTWFSDHLGMPCRLVAFPEKNPRPIDPDYALHENDHTSLSDGYPLLIIGQSSLDDLNSRLDMPVPMNRFRPNVVFTGAAPFAEDNFKRFSICNIAMAGVKPCARCVMTTIDQSTGAAGKEPLATLSSYRKVGNKVLFGQNVILLGTGTISVGDKLVL